jgi:hypothetical protein
MAQKKMVYSRYFIISRRKGKTGKKLERKYCGKVRYAGDFIPNPCDMKMIGKK